MSVTKSGIEPARPVHTSRVAADVDFDRDGKQVSWLRIPFSSNTSAHGAISTPIAVIKNGAGRTIYIQAGAHGDEFEGQVAAVKLIRELDPAMVQGRVIIVPAANLPAAEASLRCSPLDDGNLNRSFPGNPDGTPTEMIADYIANVIMPMVDVFQDLHSGGRTLRFLPLGQTRLAEKNPRKDECIAALKAFGAPYGLVTGDNGDERIASFCAYKAGAIALSSELSGGGQVSIGGTGVAERGLRNLLHHFGIVEKTDQDEGCAPSRLIRSIREGGRVLASDMGVFEPYFDLGDMVEAGAPAGAIHFIDNPERPPVIERFAASGLVFATHAPGRCVRGDALFDLAEDYA